MEWKYSSEKPKKQKMLLAAYAMIIPQVLMFGLFVVLLNRGMGIVSKEYLFISLHTFGIILSILMYLSVLRSGKYERIDYYFLLFILINCTYMFSDGLFWIVDGIPKYYRVNAVSNLLYGICPILLIVNYWFLADLMTVRKDRFYRIGTVIIITMTVVSMLFLLGNVVGEYYYIISPETGIYERGKLYSVFIIFPSVMSLTCFLYILVNKISLWDKLILLLYLVLPYVNALFQIPKSGPSLLSIETFCAIFFFYTNLYVYREKDIIERDRALTESKLRSLQLQINPHFFYNTLSSAASLCDTDPDSAQEMIYRISDYLHDNFSDVAKPSVISFSDEITHLEHYLSIEAMRFPNIQVNYDIEADAFEIPNMTLQPLVENAIKHGICKRRKSAGNLTILSRETENAYIVRISDNGVGMEIDPENLDETHIGIRNVRTRLMLLCRGELRIFSVPGIGTDCEILLPK